MRKCREVPAGGQIHDKTIKAQREILCHPLWSKSRSSAQAMCWLIKDLPPIQMYSFQRDTTKLNTLKLTYFLWCFRTEQELRNPTGQIIPPFYVSLRSSLKKSSAKRKLRKVNPDSSLWNLYHFVALLLLLLSCFSRVRLCVTPETAAHQAPSLGFSRQEHWSGLPFPSPMHESEKGEWSRSVVSDS